MTVSADGDVVFANSRGDYVAAENGATYRNVYAYRFHIVDEKIGRIDEYANPVTFAKLAGLPIG